MLGVCREGGGCVVGVWWEGGGCVVGVWWEGGGCVVGVWWECQNVVRSGSVLGGCLVGGVSVVGGGSRECRCL